MNVVVSGPSTRVGVHPVAVVVVAVAAGMVATSLARSLPHAHNSPPASSECGRMMFELRRSAFERNGLSDNNNKNNSNIKARENQQR